MVRTLDISLRCWAGDLHPVSQQQQLCVSHFSPKVDIDCSSLRHILCGAEFLVASQRNPDRQSGLAGADYCFGERKFGGNAQAITRQRWLHHTTFLWDFDDARMDLLKHPANAPAYREVGFRFNINNQSLGSPHFSTVQG